MGIGIPILGIKNIGVVFYSGIGLIVVSLILAMFVKDNTKAGMVDINGGSKS